VDLGPECPVVEDNDQQWQPVPNGRLELGQIHEHAGIAFDQK
jgi:hypothetical protein